MDDQRFDQFVRALQLSGSRRSAITALLGGIGIALTPGMAPGADAKKRGKRRGRRGKSRAEAIGRRSIEICHAPGTPEQQTMVIPRTQLNAHMRHGDVIGPCPCVPSCVGKCGGASDGCDGTCNGPCDGRCDQGQCVCSPIRQSCQTIAGCCNSDVVCEAGRCCLPAGRLCGVLCGTNVCCFGNDGTFCTGPA